MNKRTLLLGLLLFGAGGCDGVTITLPVTPTPTPSSPPIVAVRGEARMLSGATSVPLLNRSSRIRAVYSYGSDGRRIDYDSTDYVATELAIARTPGSRIPDYATYDYVRSDGDKFTFVSTPRNPPLTINYAVYIDYDAFASDRQVTATAATAANAKVLCLGDSIAAGAHTVAQFYSGSDEQSWCGLLRKFLGPTATVENVSVPGAAISGAVPQLDDLVARRPDTVILAYGMNDHLAGAAGLATFKTRLDDMIARFKSEGIRVITVGFFQRNQRYTLEDPVQTVAYNDAIRDVARTRGVPFVDIYPAMQKAAPSGAEAFTHFTADFLHHPNIYGQRIYFSLIVPHFLKRDMWASEIEDYVLAEW